MLAQALGNLALVLLSFALPAQSMVVVMLLGWLVVPLIALAVYSNLRGRAGFKMSTAMYVLSVLANLPMLFFCGAYLAALASTSG